MGSIVRDKRKIIGVLTREEVSGSFVYTCTRCGLEFPSAGSLESHFQVHRQRSTLQRSENGLEVTQSTTPSWSNGATQQRSTQQ